jgi:hypothetical protein
MTVMTASPRRWRDPLAQGCQNQAIACTPAHPLDLALKNVDLAAELRRMGRSTGRFGSEYRRVPVAA